MEYDMGQPRPEDRDVTECYVCLEEIDDNDENAFFRCKRHKVHP